MSGLYVLVAFDARERVSDLVLRNGLFFLKNSVRVSQKKCRATAAGDVTGSVGLLTEDRTAQPDAAQFKAVNVAAAFLAKQMEE